MQSIKSGDGEVDTELTRRNMQKCITWMKKSHKGVRALQEAQIHCGVKEKRLLTPVFDPFCIPDPPLLDLLRPGYALLNILPRQFCVNLTIIRLD